MAGPAVSPLRTPAERAARFNMDPTYGQGGNRQSVSDRDIRLNPHRAPYGQGAWKGNTALKPGGGTIAIPEKARTRTIPASPAKATYGSGQFVPRHEVEHPDCAGFAGRTLPSGLQSPANLTPKPPLSRGMSFATDAVPSNPYTYGSGAPAYGAGNTVSPAVKMRHDPNPGVAGVHYGARKGGVSENKYLPIHAEMVMGYNAAVPDYGHGDFASPVKAMVHAKYGIGHPWSERRDLAGYGAFVSPRSGVY